MRRLVLGLLLLLLGPAVVLGESPPAVTIRVVDLAEVGSEPLVVSLGVTQSLFDAVGITVSWRHCVDEVDDCSDPLLPHEVWLRVAPGNAERDGWADDWVSPQALGFSNVAQSPHTSVMSTVFVEQVARLAHAAGIGPADLLGRVAAHEVAQLLLGTAAHTATGLMGARWSVRASPEYLQFSSNVGSQLRVAMAQRGQPGPQADGGPAPADTAGHQPIIASRGEHTRLSAVCRYAETGQRRIEGSLQESSAAASDWRSEQLKNGTASPAPGPAVPAALNWEPLPLTEARRGREWAALGISA